MLGVEALPGLMDVVSTRSEDFDCAAELRRRSELRAIVRGTNTRAPSYSYAADVLCKIARMRFPGVQLQR
jgi:hypothetical protein